MSRSFLTALVCFFLVTQSSVVRAHDGSHSTKAEMQWNEKARTIEVALRFDTEDLSRALAGRNGKKVKNFEERAKDYVNTRFRLKSGRKTLPLRWVGWEKEGDDTVWTFFEFPVGSANPNQCELTNNLLYSTNSNQKNAVEWKQAKKSTAIIFSSRMRSAPLGTS